MKEKIRFEETIIVEGKNDVQAVRQGVEANFIITSGFGINKEILKQIKKAQETTGAIILTDPDFMGDRIREILNNKIPGIKNAFLSRNEAKEKDDIGVENASAENIIKALKKARAIISIKKDDLNGLRKTGKSISLSDIYGYGLTGVSGSDQLRELVAGILGLGYCNSKQLVHRIKVYGVTGDELEKAIETAIEMIKKTEESENCNGKR